jgi:hypothetical protein
MKELESQSPIDPEKHQFFKQFKEAVWVCFAYLLKLPSHDFLTLPIAAVT